MQNDQNQKFIDINSKYDETIQKKQKIKEGLKKIQRELYKGFKNLNLQQSCIILCSIIVMFMAPYEIISRYQEFSFPMFIIGILFSIYAVLNSLAYILTMLFEAFESAKTD